MKTEVESSDHGAHDPLLRCTWSGYAVRSNTTGKVYKIASNEGIRGTAQVLVDPVKLEMHYGDKVIPLVDVSLKSPTQD